MMTTISGYTYGDTDLAPSPVGMDELAALKTSLMWTDADREALRRAGEILIPRTAAILDVWYGFIGSTPHLVSTFVGGDGEPDGDYLGAVRRRFAQWIADVCTRDHDADWLAYQEEIALRHHTEKKNRTDGVDSSSDHVPLRHMMALIVPVTLSIRPFLEEGEADTQAVDAMYNAWFKAVALSVILWSRPYSPAAW